jgi:hypothetical protein
MRVGHCTGILRLRALMDDILFYGEENVRSGSVSASANFNLSFEASFSFKPFVYLKCEPNL